MIDEAVMEIEPLLGTAPAWALSGLERELVLGELYSERFVDCSPAQVYATLLDEGRYLASERTMYRLLAANGELRERRDQLAHPPYARPELLAERPNEVWSWDISKLKGPAKWTCFYLYVILDVFSRYAVGWTVQRRETASLAEQLISQTLEKQQIARDQLTIHADRGSSMTSKPVAFLLADLGVLKTHSRPYTSTDNPYSEAHFKTLKYRPGFPCGVPKRGARPERSAICRQDADFGTPHPIARSTSTNQMPTRPRQHNHPSARFAAATGSAGSSTSTAEPPHETRHEYWRPSGRSRDRRDDAQRRAADRPQGAHPRRPAAAVCDLAAFRLRHQPQRAARARRARAPRPRRRRARDPRPQRTGTRALPLRPLQRQRRLDGDRLPRPQPTPLDRAARAARRAATEGADAAPHAARPARPPHPLGPPLDAAPAARWPWQADFLAALARIRAIPAPG
jgi:transposase InsO family protein